MNERLITCDNCGRTQYKDGSTFYCIWCGKDFTEFKSSDVYDNETKRFLEGV